jgi:hypothetical protein
MTRHWLRLLQTPVPLTHPIVPARSFTGLSVSRLASCRLRFPSSAGFAPAQWLHSVPNGLHLPMLGPFLPPLQMPVYLCPWIPNSNPIRKTPRQFAGPLSLARALGLVAGLGRIPFRSDGNFLSASTSAAVLIASRPFLEVSAMPGSACATGH